MTLFTHSEKGSGEGSSFRSSALPDLLSFQFFFFILAPCLSRMALESLRRYFWLWVIVGVVLVSMLIIVIFILVIKCVYKRGTSVSAPPPWRTSMSSMDVSADSHCKHLLHQRPGQKPDGSSGPQTHYIIISSSNNNNHNNNNLFQQTQISCLDSPKCRLSSNPLAFCLDWIVWNMMF